MFWAATTLAYFGFLRSAEFPVPSLSAFNPDIHLTVDDIAIDSHTSPSCLQLTIKASKTDPFRKGCCLYIGLGRPPLCALSAIMNYLPLRGQSPGPLLLLSSGQPLSRTLLTQWLKDFFAAAGIQGSFSSHSFRIGAATVAARMGVPDHLIQAVGRWNSDAYKLYIRTPAEALLSSVALTLRVGKFSVMLVCLLCNTLFGLLGCGAWGISWNGRSHGPLATVPPLSKHLLA